MKSISDIIRKLPASLQEFLQTSNKNRDITIKPILHKILGSKLANHCQITNYYNGKLTIVIDAAVYYSQIYYRIPELTTKLKQLSDYAELREIKCSMARNTKKFAKTGGNFSKPRSRGLPNRISRANEELWHQLIKNLKNSKSAK